MIGGLGPLEMFVLVGIFFVLFGAERLPKMANAIGRSKGEFQKGLADTTRAVDPSKAIEDMDAGGRTAEQRLFERAKAVGIDPAGMEVNALETKVKALEALESEE
ncbi:MAG TPA: twin-arginine translocase TatA/TatE family subunit [Candidatus Poseidoniaceae archaeon]|jgi:sec-independent protein translocase protein TatA|nr:MAG TPA: twin-arginine translocase TatA/TatE family subunit [Candidatus Poseidoniales archaeon]HII11435.1 twin-arginine translocase TatA/TatE family subunit [Candidatus Poseidoniaceae archaeon]|tara:strand:- start:1309 stop:1623 length:315 start_codon:yes stop_codon:yes gene_type:complete